MMRSLPSRQTCLCFGLTAALVTALLVSMPMPAQAAERTVLAEEFTDTS